jgi:hypothetical protein
MKLKQSIVIVLEHTTYDLTTLDNFIKKTFWTSMLYDIDSF